MYTKKGKEMDRGEFYRAVDRITEKFNELEFLSSSNGVCQFNENDIKEENRTIPDYDELLGLMKENRVNKENLNKIFGSFFNIVKSTFLEIVEKARIEERSDDYSGLLSYIIVNLNNDKALRVKSFSGNFVLFENGKFLETWLFPVEDSDEKRIKGAQDKIDSIRKTIKGK